MSSINNNICNCPIKGCNSKIGSNSKSYSDHISDNHKSLAHKFDLFNGRTNFISICNLCTSRRFVKGFHHHCRECSIYFHNHTDLDKHLKEKHRKYYLETSCRKGIACEGFVNDEPCGFAHFDVEKFPRFASTEPGVNFTCDEDYIDDKYLQYGICPNEKPMDDIRCQSITCKHNHYRGRVKFLMQARNRARTHAASQKTTNPVSSEVIINESTDTFSSPPVLMRSYNIPVPEHFDTDSEEQLSIPIPLTRSESEDPFSSHVVLISSESEFLFPRPVLVRLESELLPRNLDSEFSL